MIFFIDGSEDGIYISFADLRPYIIQDQACTKVLQEWFTKQFDVVSIMLNSRMLHHRTRCVIYFDCNRASLLDNLLNLEFHEGAPANVTRLLIVSSFAIQGPSRLVAEEGKSKCAWVTLDDVTNRFIRGWLPNDENLLSLLAMLSILV